MKTGFTYTQYTTTNSGLPDDFINCINIDDSGRVWIGTAVAGLACYSTLTGLENKEAQNILAVYPNPARDFINVSYTEALSSVSIVSVEGKVVCPHDNHVQLTGNYTHIDLSQLNSGIYFAKTLTVSGKVFYCRFVKL
jgi:ligand-binding sensor domain-containing protein